MAFLARFETLGFSPSDELLELKQVWEKMSTKASHHLVEETQTRYVLVREGYPTVLVVEDDHNSQPHESFDV